MHCIQKIYSKHKNSFLLVSLFAVCVLCYGLVALQMDSTRSGRADESIYINMARSFFYDHTFMRGGEPMGYDCILYSIIISVCYIFYTPVSILPLMRLVGIFIMCSAIFPAYMLANKILQNHKLSLVCSLISVIFPSMTLSYYMYQEVLLYPLVLWFLYYIYTNIGQMTYKHYVITGAFIYLLYNTKTICMYILVAYVLFLIIEGLLFNKKLLQTFFKIILVCFTFFILYIFVRFGINFLNGFKTQQSHYDTQISSSVSLFLGNLKFYIIQAFRGVIFYTYYSLFSVLVFPIVMPIVGYKSLSNKDKRFLLFITICIATAIIIIVGGIFLLEDSGSSTPRFHSRYYFGFFIPFIILNLKLDYKKISIPLPIYIILFILLLYPLIAADGTIFFSSFVDNYLFSIFEAVNIYLARFSHLLLRIGFIMIIILTLVLLLKKNILTKSFIIKLLFVFFLSLNLANNAIILGYKSVTQMERQIDFDCIKLSTFLNENDGLSIFIDQDNVYSRVLNYNTQLNKDYYYITISRLNNRALKLDENIRYVIIPNELSIHPYDSTKIDIGLDTASLYYLNSSSLSFEHFIPLS